MSFNIYSVFLKKYYKIISIVTIFFVLLSGSVLVYFFLHKQKQNETKNNILKTNFISKPLQKKQKNLFKILSDGTIQEYDSVGQLIRIQKNDLIQEFKNQKLFKEQKNVGPLKTVIKEFNIENGQIQKETHVSKEIDNKIYIYKINDFNEKGKLTKFTIKKQKEGKKEIIEQETFLDDQERKEKQNFYDEEGLLKETCLYDDLKDKKILIKQIGYSKTGKMKYEKDMNKVGNVIKETIFNSDGKSIYLEREYYENLNSQDKSLIYKETIFEPIDTHTVKKIVSIFDEQGLNIQQFSTQEII
ncbi:hypothetical protein [Candidatus Phytoplasma oryzae]|nr:hypothetical protein PIE28_02095 [Candidatus Phytoplasma oryzae]